MLRTMASLILADRKATAIQILLQSVRRRAFLDAQHIVPGNRWTAAAEAAEDHTKCHCCQLRTGS